MLVLSEPRRDEMGACVAFGLEPTVYTRGGVAAAAEGGGRPRRASCPVHLKIDTGCTGSAPGPPRRCGLADAVAAEPALELASVFTHCAVADEPDDPYTGEQLRPVR